MAETGFQCASDDDPECLQALQRYGILDTPMEPAYDDLARIAAMLVQLNYRGPVTCSARQTRDPFRALLRTRALLNQLQK